MKVTASKPYKVKLKAANGSERVRYQVKFWTEDAHTGNLKTIAQKTFKTKIEAKDRIAKLIGEYEKTGGKIIVGEKMTFADLAAHAKKTIYRPAVILAGRKTAGVKKHKAIHGQIDILCRHFGSMRVGNISTADLENYQEWRYGLGSLRGKGTTFVPITLTTINRELATMRRMMKHAFASGWIPRDIFLGSNAIDAGAEKERQRILSAFEEVALLEHCKRHEHHRVKKAAVYENEFMKAIILLALDSGMRKTEILKLRWQDVDLKNGEARLISEHTKTQTERRAPISDRAIDELKTLPTFAKDGRIFPIEDFKKFWKTTKEKAGIEDLRFHDLRRTAVTRMQMEGVPLAVAGKIAGHANLETTSRVYTATNPDIVQSARERINAGIRERIEGIQQTGDSNFVN